VVPRYAVSILTSFLSLRAGAVGAQDLAAPIPVHLPSRLTLDESVRIFEIHGLDLLIADAAVRSAAADVVVARATPNPSLSVTGGSAFFYDPNVPDCNGCSRWAWNIALSDQAALSDRLSGKRHLRVAIAEAALRAARMSRQDARRTLAFQVKQQYMQAVLAGDLLDFALEVQKASTQILDLNEVRYRAGAISEADVAKVETAKLEADQAVTSARQNLAQAKAVLAFLLGVRGEVPDFSVQEDLPKFALPGPLAAANLSGLVREAMDRRPDVQSLRAQRVRAETSVKLARRLRIPDVSVTVNQYGQGFGQNAIQPPTLTLGLSFPMPIFYRYRGEMAKAEADATTQNLQLAKLEAQVLSDVTTAFTAFSAARELVERMERRLLERSRRARDLVSIQYQKGAASLLEYLDAQRTYIATNVEYLQDLAMYWGSVFQLELAVAMDLR
jgi:cobalt-zinc-cadmium efflux system outer membrane protein